MENVLMELLAIASFIAVFTTAFMQVFKMAFDKFPTKFVPFVALFVGIGFGYLAHISFDIEMTLPYAIWGGGIAGLASVGLFENVKKMFNSDADVFGKKGK